MSNTHLPAILDTAQVLPFQTISEQERDFISQAARLFEAEFYDHSLLDIWNAAVANLRRRVEAYGVDLFQSVVREEAGRKKYDADGETPSERWSGVDDLVLVAGATRLGLLNKKAGKSLEMINWMRNHASPAHGSDHRVEREDVIGLVLILQKNLFEVPLPDPGHSVSGLFHPVKTSKLGHDSLQMLSDQIAGLKQADLRIAFGFMLDLLCEGSEPAIGSVKVLFPRVWERAPEELRRTAGLRYHAYVVDPSQDGSTDQGARARLLDFLSEVNGIQYIPEAARALLYRHAAKNLAAAKDASYGWSAEFSAAKTLAQFGPYVPSIAFEEVYQEILTVWCGNYWGRSGAYSVLGPFFDALNTTQIVDIARIVQRNERVRSELFQSRPRTEMINLLKGLKPRLTIASHKAEIDRAVESITN